MSEFRVEREKLVEWMDILQLVPAVQSAQSSEKIMIEPKKYGARFTLAASAAGYVDVKGKGKWPFKNTIYIDRRLFMPFVSVAKDIHSKSDFVFSANGKDLKVRNGTRKVEMGCAAPVKGYYPMGRKSLAEIKVEKAFSALLKSARICVEQEGVDPIFNCVFIKKSGSKMMLYAKSTHHWFRAKIKTKCRLGENFPFPPESIGVLEDPRLKKIEVNDRQIIFDMGSGKIWQELSIKAKKKYPHKEFDNIVSDMEKAKTAFVADSNKFAIVLGRMASYLSSVNRQDWVVKLLGKKNGKASMEISTTVNKTTFKERLDLSKVPTLDFDVDWPLKYALPILESVAEKDHDVRVAFNDVKQSYVSMHGVEILVPRRSK